MLCVPDGALEVVAQDAERAVHIRWQPRPRHVDVAIVGAGVCGMALAAALTRRGRVFTIWEQSAEEGAAAGQGFVLLDAGVRALLGLGVRPERVGRSVTGVEIRDASGAIVLSEPLRDAFSVRRGDLLAALRAAIPDDCLTGGCRIDDVEIHPQHAVLLSRARRVGSARYVVGCDGIRSAVRRSCFGEHPLRKGRVDELLFPIRDQSVIEAFAGRLCKWMDRGRHLAIGGLDLGAGKGVVFLQFPSRGALNAGDVRTLLGEFESVFGAVLPRNLVRDLANACPYLWSAHDLDPPAAVVRDGVILAGDAAQPLLPFTSQGVANALTDACDLSYALSADGAEASRTLLEAYATSRRVRAIRQVRRGRDIERDFFSSSPVPVLPLALETARGV